MVMRVQSYERSMQGSDDDPCREENADGSKDVYNGREGKIQRTQGNEWTPSSTLLLSNGLDHLSRHPKRHQ